MKIFSVVGLHNSGKTTCVESLIKFIRSKNMSVSSIKDIHSENFTMEKTGSNSHRHLTASNSYVFARGLKETHLIWNRQLSFKEMTEHISTQWLIVEGMKETALPKIIAVKDVNEINTLIDNTVFAITGIFSDNYKETHFNGIPVINAIKHPDKLGELVFEKVFEALPQAKDGYCGHCGYNCFEMTAKILNGNASRKDCALKTILSEDDKSRVMISFNGIDVPLNEWVRDISYDLITALCKNLKGYKEGDKIEIKIN